jgi:hypothetical protein
LNHLFRFAPHACIRRQVETKKGCPKAAFFLNSTGLAVGDVHRYFKAKAHFGVFGFGPHGHFPFKQLFTGGCL